MARGRRDADASKLATKRTRAAAGSEAQAQRKLAPHSERAPEQPSNNDKSAASQIREAASEAAAVGVTAAATHESEGNAKLPADHAPAAEPAKAVVSTAALATALDPPAVRLAGDRSEVAVEATAKSTGPKRQQEQQAAPVEEETAETGPVSSGLLEPEDAPSAAQLTAEQPTGVQPETVEASTGPTLSEKEEIIVATEFDRAGEQAEATTKAVFGQASEQAEATTKAVVGQFSDAARQQLERSSQAYSELNDLARGNVEAWMAASRAATQGMGAIAQALTNLSRRSFEDSTSAFRTLAAAKSPAEFFHLQSEFAKTQCDHTIADVTRLSETTLKAVIDVAEPISNRVAVAAEQYTKTMVR
jgi:phasin family protein